MPLKQGAGPQVQGESDAQAGSLKSWKAIANYLHRDVRTAQRWERDEGLPVHRHEHLKRATVFAYPGEIDAWLADRQQAANQEPKSKGGPLSQPSWLIAGVGILATLLLVFFWTTREPVTPSPAAKARLTMVSPFLVEGDLGSERPADGLAAILSEHLAAAEQIMILGRASARTLSDAGTPLATLRDDFGINLVLSGEITQTPDATRVSAELRDTEGGNTLWSGEFAYPRESWSSIQDAAAGDILDGLASRLDIPRERRAGQRKSTPNAEEHVVLGNYYLDAFSAANFDRALFHFRKALEYDPASTDAYVGMAYAYGSAAFWGAMPSDIAYRELKDAAEHIARLDPDNGIADSLLGWVQFVYYWNWEDAERLLRSGLARAPDSAQAHYLLAYYLCAMGEGEESVTHIQQAAHIDPVSPFILIGLGDILAYAGHSSAAIEQWHKTAERLDLPEVGFFTRFAYEQAGDFQSAIDSWSHIQPELATALGDAYLSDGAAGYWRVIASVYESDLAAYPNQFNWHYAIAKAGAGDTDAAMAMLSRGFHQRDAAMVFLPVYPLSPLYNDPRFRAIAEQMGLSGRFDFTQLSPAPESPEGGSGEGGERL